MFHETIESELANAIKYITPFTPDPELPALLKNAHTSRTAKSVDILNCIQKT